ncbi:dienelactone hydrolase [Nitrobacteraceae bacterium AZCC 2146]
MLTCAFDLMNCADTTSQYYKRKLGDETIIAIDRTAPFYDSRGWMQWPGNENYSFQFMRVLGAAQEGGSTVSECLLAASGIDPACEESWYQQWKKAADLNKARGDIALARGHVKTALSNWLRAANYYSTAQAFMKVCDVRRDTALTQMLACSQLYLRHVTPVGEVVEIAWSDDKTLQGYFLPAPGRSRRAPVVVCIGAPDQYKEEHLYRMPRYAHERGLSLLLVDLPGQGYRRTANHAFGRYDIETAISNWVDYLVDRSDVDPRKIAIFGDGLGASFATRGAAFDDRFAAAVCDAGIWDLHERAFLATRLSGGTATADFADDIDKLCRSSIARNIRCPMLVALGEHDWLDAGHVTQCCDALIAGGQEIELKIFSASETAASHAQLDNPTIGNEFIFDWIADRLGRKK